MTKAEIIQEISLKTGVEKNQVQELRRQGPGQTGRQKSEVPALRRDRVQS